MRSTDHIHKNLIERFSEQAGPENKRIAIPDDGEHNSERIKQFFKTAEHRKRQILERMLLD